jgi:Flagellar basal body-associated protein
MADPTVADAQASAPQNKASMLLGMIVAALFAAAAAAGAVYWFAAKANNNAEAVRDARMRAPAIYIELDPPFVVNFEARGVMRFLQVAIQVMTRDPLTADLIKAHDAVIRNDLLMLLSGQSYEVLSTREGKEQLRTEALQVVIKAIEAEGGDGSRIEQLYFTSFVMQ